MINLLKETRKIQCLQEFTGLKLLIMDMNQQMCGPKMMMAILKLEYMIIIGINIFECEIKTVC